MPKKLKRGCNLTAKARKLKTVSHDHRTLAERRAGKASRLQWWFKNRPYHGEAPQ